MSKVSVVMPMYGAEKFVSATIESVLAQTFSDFELIIIDDLSPDRSLEICQGYDDPRIRIITHRENRGPAGARNTGIKAAIGTYIALLDSDDMWENNKLERHVAHLDSDTSIGLSFSPSTYINNQGVNLNTWQMPKLTNITPQHLLCKNPISNCSTPVIRNKALVDIGFRENFYGSNEIFYFDDRIQQYEDLECWLRLASLTDWKIEGLTEPLTICRLNPSNLSTNILENLENWNAVIEKARSHSPELVEAAGSLAKASQLRKLAHQAIGLQDGPLAMSLCWQSLRQDVRILLKEPAKTMVMLFAALIQYVAPNSVYSKLEPIAASRTANTQKIHPVINEMSN